MALAYTTQKSVVIRSARLGALYYGLVFAVLLYVAYFLVYLQRGYQFRASAVGNFGLKVKGQATVRDAKTGEKTVYDANDLVIYEPSGFFIATAIATTLQARGTCPGMDDDETCTEDEATCSPGAYSPSGQMTGRCLATTARDENGNVVKRCEVNGWCPGEPEKDDVHVLDNVGEFTIFTRISVEFPGVPGEQNVLWTNLNGTKPTRGWNLWTLNDLLQSGGMTVDDIATTGWDGRVDVEFDCNLDLGIEACAPKTPYTLKQVMYPNTLSKGYNMRWISATNVGEPRAQAGVVFANETAFGSGKDVRLVVKGYGPRIRFSVTGSGRKFDWLVLSTTIGAGVAFLGIATVIVNSVAMYCSGPRSKQYADWLFTEFHDTPYGSTEGAK